MSRAKAYFHGTTLICAQQHRVHLSDPGSDGRLSAGCSEVAVFRAGQGLAPNVLSLWNGGWKTRFLIAFSILHIYYDTEISCCQQKKPKSGVRNRAEN